MIVLVRVLGKEKKGRRSDASRLEREETRRAHENERVGSFDSNSEEVVRDENGFGEDTGGDWGGVELKHSNRLKNATNREKSANVLFSRMEERRKDSPRPEQQHPYPSGAD